MQDRRNSPHCWNASREAPCLALHTRMKTALFPLSFLPNPGSSAHRVRAHARPHTPSLPGAQPLGRPPPTPLCPPDASIASIASICDTSPLRAVESHRIRELSILNTTVATCSTSTIYTCTVEMMGCILFPPRAVVLRVTILYGAYKVTAQQPVRPCSSHRGRGPIQFTASLPPYNSLPASHTIHCQPPIQYAQPGGRGGGAGSGGEW